MAIVTLSGQVGSGGQEIGRETATLLGADFVDRELLAEAARRTGIGLQEWTAHDMHVATMTERIAHLFQGFLERSALGYTGDPYLSGEPILSRTYQQMAESPTTPEHHLNNQRFLDVTTQIIRELADIGNVVIVGRGASYLMRDNPRALRVLTIASREVRERVVVERQRVQPAEAARYVESEERHRVAFLKKFFHVDPLDPNDFDLVLNTGRLDARQYAEVVAIAARALDARVVGGA
ncbi:MAG: cytidylate kinase-like family protein [Chloroflexi bacterium]|nr:cytidylate kinase-like family protein [Chloroflexota bacterium]